MTDRDSATKFPDIASPLAHSKYQLHSTSLDKFISQCATKNHNTIQDKPLNVSQLITIPTTPVKRRRHRNDTKPATASALSGRKSKSSDAGNSRMDSKSKLKSDSSSKSSPLKLPGVKLSSPNVKNFDLSKEKLFKYRQWFMSIDADGSGTVDRTELFDSFLSAGVVANHKICSKLFEVMDADMTGEVDFERFIRTITASSMSKSVQLHKLDAMINSQSALSTETLLSQERRKILMKFVVDQDKLHDFERDSLVTSSAGAQSKLAKLHKPIEETRIKKSYSKELNTKELDSMIASTQKSARKPLKRMDTPAEVMVDVLPKGNLERRRTRVNGTSLGIQDGALNLSERRGAIVGKPNILKQQRSFNIVDLIKKKEMRVAEIKLNAEVQEQFTHAIATEKKVLTKSTSLPEKSNRKSALEELALVLPSQIMNMMNERKLVDTVDEDDEEEESDSDCDNNSENKDRHSDQPFAPPSQLQQQHQERLHVDSSHVNSATAMKNGRFISPIKVKTPTKVSKLSFLNDDESCRKGNSVVLRPIGCRFY